MVGRGAGAPAAVAQAPRRSVQTLLCQDRWLPSFKRQSEEPGVRFPEPKQFELDQQNQRIKLPKVGWVRMRMSPPVVGTLRNVSRTREGAGASARWFASNQVQTCETIAVLGVAPTLVIDLGLVTFAATSQGEIVAPLKAIATQQCRLRRYQRSVSRKQKGSAIRRKAVTSLHRRIVRQRADWLHKLTTEFADRHPVIALEDLCVKNMSASARGTRSALGKNMRQKAGLNRGILDAA